MTYVPNAQPIRVIDGPSCIGYVIGRIDHSFFLQNFAVALFCELIVGSATDNLAFQSVQGLIIDDGT